MADLKFSSNDPMNTEFDVPITMNLTGIPQIAIWPEEVDYSFNSVYIDQSSSIDLGIYNSGTGVLTVEAALDGIYFSVSETAMEILPYEWKVLTVHYIPEAEGSHTSTLTLTTNDPEVGTVSINFSGNGLISPIAGISIDSIGVYVSQEDSLTRSFEITNTGGSDLAWSLSSQSVGLDFSLEIKAGLCQSLDRNGKMH